MREDEVTVVVGETPLLACEGRWSSSEPLHASRASGGIRHANGYLALDE
jgi:hypothetical protein